MPSNIVNFPLEIIKKMNQENEKNYSFNTFAHGLFVLLI